MSGTQPSHLRTSYLFVELIGSTQGLVVEEAAGAPVPDRPRLLLLVRVEHVEQGEQVALGHFEVPLGDPRLIALVRRLQVDVLHLQHGHNDRDLLRAAEAGGAEENLGHRRVHRKLAHVLAERSYEVLFRRVIWLSRL